MVLEKGNAIQIPRMQSLMRWKEKKEQNRTWTIVSRRQFRFAISQERAHSYPCTRRSIRRKWYRYQVITYMKIPAFPAKFNKSLILLVS